MKKSDVCFCAMYLCLTVIGATMIKAGAAKESGSFYIMSRPISKELIIGVLLYGFSFLMYTFVISQMQISLVIPLMAGINSIAIVLLGVIIFKERLAAGQVLGVAVIIAGIVVLGMFS
ncbi:MAG: hypothetical protein IJT96_10605 [Lachnospiraceae bacterium]|nr:hypothetical protein [Lachnospiraceae bacterium]MBQ9828403.1 hypothetical protein [Lachnospiraceae bacterium]